MCHTLSKLANIGVFGGIFLVIAISFAVLSCGDADSGQNRIGAGNSAELGPEEITNNLQPDSALVIVRDIAAFWEDCGCSGFAVGGVSRYASAALNASNITYVFVGRTVLPHGAGLTTEVSEESKAAAPWYAGLALNVFKELENVWWIPDEAELLVLRDLESFDDLSGYLEDKNSVRRWQNLSLTFNKSTIHVKEWDKNVSLPRKHNRGRDITVIANWNTDPASVSRFIPELTTLALLRGLSIEVKEEFKKLTASSAEHVGGFWKTDITGENEQAANIVRASAGKRLILHHLGGDSKVLVPVANGMASASHIKKNCADCHKQAVATWLTTKHASAMDTLRARMRDDDPRCVPCHSVKHKTSSAGAKVAVVHHGVQCENCHKDGIKPAETCKDCHNGLTDPKKHFMAYIKSICNGSQDKLAGSCKK